MPLRNTGCPCRRPAQLPDLPPAGKKDWALPHNFGAIFGKQPLLSCPVKTVFLAALLLLTGPAARAQEYYLDLTAQTLGEANGVVAVTQVLDGRAGNPPIGIVYRGVAGKAAAVAFRQGLETELTAFVRAQLPVQPALHRVVLCLRSLHVGETVGGNKEQATGNITADAYEELPDGYHFVQRVGAQASAHGHEVTGRHAGHVALLLGQCLGQLVMADWAAARAQPARALGALRTGAPPSGRAAAILREAPRRGLYLRYEQFLANRPDTSFTFRVDTLRRRFNSPLAAAQWQGVARLLPQVTSRKEPRPTAADLWGFCDGQHAYVRYEKYFFPLMRQHNFFTFVGEAPLDQLHAAALAEAQSRTGVMFGLLGAALAQTRVPDHSAEPMAYGLDPLTGALGPYPGLRTPVRPDTAYLYLYRPHQATATESVSVYVEGRIMGALWPGQYLEVPWFRFGKPLRLGLSGVSGAGSCQYLVPNTAQLNYLRINPSPAEYPWQWVPPAQGAADLDALDKLRK